MTIQPQRIIGKVIAQNVPAHVNSELSPIDHALHMMDETDRAVWAQNIEIQMSQNLLETESLK